MVTSFLATAGTRGRLHMTEAPIPPMSPCPDCGAAALLIRPALPVVCFHCHAVRFEVEKTASTVDARGRVDGQLVAAD